MLPPNNIPGVQFGENLAIIIVNGLEKRKYFKALTSDFISSVVLLTGLSDSEQFDLLQLSQLFKS